MNHCTTSLVPLPACSWSKAEIEDFLRGANVINSITEHGLRHAATEGFREKGYRLATISRDFEPFDHIHKMSLYMLGDQPRLGRKEAKRLAQSVMVKIGLRLRPDECHVDVSGRRLVVSVALPRWAWTPS